MATTFSLNQNGWKIDSFFGSTSTSALSYIRNTDTDRVVPASASFPGVQANSPYLVDPNGFVHVIFGTYDSGTSAWTWLEPTVDESTFTFSITGSDAVVYPFVFIDRVAYCTHALTNFDGSGGANTVAVNTLCAGTHQLGTINWQSAMTDSLLPPNGVPIIIDERESESESVIIDISRYVYQLSNSLNVNIGAGFQEFKAPSIFSSCTIYVFEPISPPKPVTLLATQMVTTYTITSDDKVAYTLNNYIAVDNYGTMTVTNSSGANTLTINDYATQPSDFQAPSGTGITYTAKTQTHFLLRQNGWKQAIFDGSKLSYAGTTQVQAVSAFPKDDSAESSHWFTSAAHPGFTIIFGTHSDSSWTWLIPTIMDDLFMFSINSSAADDTMIVYPFVVSRANDGEAAKVSCVKYYNGIHSGKGTSIAYPFVGTAQSATVSASDKLDINTFLPTSVQNIPIALDGTKAPVIINITDYYESDLDIYNVIHIMFAEQKDMTNGPNIDEDVLMNIYVLLDASSLQPITIENIPNNAPYIRLTNGVTSSSITINNYVSFGANSFIEISNNTIFNDYAVQPIGFEPFVAPTAKYNYAPIYPHTAATPVQQIAHLQSVQRNLQTIFDRLNAGLIDDESQHYVATGVFSAVVWEQFRSLASEVIGGGSSGSSSGLTEIKEYSVTIPNEADPANITVTINAVPYTLYIAHSGAYYAVQGSSAGITVAGLSDGPDWSTLTGDVVTFTTVGSSTKLFFNGVMQSIVTDWTTGELGDVSGNIGNKIVAWVGNKAVPFITFKNVQPSFILVPSS